MSSSMLASILSWSQVDVVLAAAKERRCIRSVDAHSTFKMDIQYSLDGQEFSSKLYDHEGHIVGPVELRSRISHNDDAFHN